MFVRPRACGEGVGRLTMSDEGVLRVTAEVLMPLEGSDAPRKS